MNEYKIMNKLLDCFVYETIQLLKKINDKMNQLINEEINHFINLKSQNVKE